MSIRPPFVAGTFYPEPASELRRQVEAFLGRGPKTPALAVVAPHAGYVYSGGVAGRAIGAAEIPARVVLLCFNHGGRGAEVAIWPEGAWRTPLGDVPVDAALAERLRKACPEAEFDESGHLGEHSGEVLVPFLQGARPDVRIVPVALSAGLDRSALLTSFGAALAGIREEFLVVASTDLNHYEDLETTLRKDAAALREIEALDAEGLASALRRERISMCGYAPVLATIAFARARGARRARTLAHATSGDVSGEMDRVVGYAGVLVPALN
jgi:AmmeMemoRadiSam system protein B